MERTSEGPRGLVGRIEGVSFSERVRVHGDEGIQIGAVFVIGRYARQAGRHDRVHGACPSTIGGMDIGDGGLFECQGTSTGNHRGPLCWEALLGYQCASMWARRSPRNSLLSSISAALDTRRFRVIRRGATRISWVWTVSALAMAK